MRSTAVTQRLSLAVIKDEHACRALGPALLNCLVEIDGVAQVHIDGLRATIQVLYDGKEATAENIRRFLDVTGWAAARDGAGTCRGRRPTGRAAVRGSRQAEGIVPA